MIYFAIILLALSAVLGLLILIKWLSKKNASRTVVYSHGLVAAAGLLLLVFYAIQNPANFPKASLILLVVAALGGFYMFFNDLKQKPSPIAIAFIHALLAVSGFLCLVIFAIS